MTRQEIDAELQYLNERQLACADVVRQSDAHACKCVKLSKTFEEEYPEEYAAYVAALAEFRRNEERIAVLETMEPEEDERLELDYTDGQQEG